MLTIVVLLINQKYCTVYEKAETIYISFTLACFAAYQKSRFSFLDLLFS
jgi:hypothetical protein